MGSVDEAQNATLALQKLQEQQAADLEERAADDRDARIAELQEEVGKLRALAPEPADTSSQEGSLRLMENSVRLAQAEVTQLRADLAAKDTEIANLAFAAQAESAEGDARPSIDAEQHQKELQRLQATFQKQLQEAESRTAALDAERTALRAQLAARNADSEASSAL